MTEVPNHPAAGKAEIASWLRFKPRWFGLPDLVRSPSPPNTA